MALFAATSKSILLATEGRWKHDVPSRRLRNAGELRLLTRRLSVRVLFGEPNESDDELSGLLVDGAAAWTCWKWPILRKASLSSFARAARRLAQVASPGPFRVRVSESPPRRALLVNCAGIPSPPIACEG